MNKNALLRNPVLYVPVRKALDDGYEWADSGCASADLAQAKHNAAKLDKRLPQWAKANPVQRVVSYKVEPEY